jgi:hypothetical protein
MQIFKCQIRVLIASQVIANCAEETSEKQTWMTDVYGLYLFGRYWMTISLSKPICMKIQNNHEMLL